MSRTQEIITESIIRELEKGIVPWNQPWRGGDLKPANFISKKPYSGINRLLLSFQHFSTPYFLTFNQVKKLKGMVKAGSKGNLIVFYKPETEKIQVKDEVLEVKPDERVRYILQYYYVFNLSQTEGIPYELPAEKKDIALDKVLENYKDMPTVKDDSEAYYQPGEDIIGMPGSGYFLTTEDYYKTLWHEAAHSTGHPSRLDRIDKTARFGSEVYSKEELVAEICSAFLANDAGLNLGTNSVAYIGGWLKKLKEDKTLILSAAGKAQKAYDYIIGAAA